MKKQKFYPLWLCLILIVVFIMQNIIPAFTDLFILDKAKILYSYEFWRFATSIFLHGSIVHLLYNLFALALFGIILEKFIGSKNFLLVFFLSGIFANVVAVNFYNSSLGVSGAIYGILGGLVLIKPNMMVWAFGFPMPMFVAGILWVAGSVLGIFIPSNTGHIAHLSGIIIGFILGFVFIMGRRNKKFKEKKVIIPETYIKNWENEYMR